MIFLFLFIVKLTRHTHTHTNIHTHTHTLRKLQHKKDQWDEVRLAILRHVIHYTGPFFLATLRLNCEINSPPGAIRVQCSSPYGSMTTGFQVMAHLSNSSASSKVYVKRSINLLTPAVIQVEESGTYHIAVFARREEGGILNSTGEYYSLVMVAMEGTITGMYHLDMNG